jgi:hypothetical protein
MVVIKTQYEPTIKLSDGAFEWLALHPEEQDVVERFVSLMIEELAANNGKGNRPGWLQMDRKEAIGEVHWHAAKLATAAKQLAEGGVRWVDDVEVSGGRIERRRGLKIEHGEAPKDRVREHAADVANCALMVLDCMGLLTSPLDSGAA